MYIARLRIARLQSNNLAIYIAVLKGFLAFLIVNMYSECQMPVVNCTLSSGKMPWELDEKQCYCARNDIRKP